MSTDLVRSDPRQVVAKMGGQFAAALPKHVPSERFVRVVQTAINLNPDLAKGTPRTLLASCMKAAQDGLMPDGREGALVVYGSTVQWMPMIAGLLKKARNSGEIASITAHVVHQNDTFKLVLGDNESIRHEPCLDDEPGPARLVYAVCKLKGGAIVREWMTVAQIEKVRAASKSKNSGPWKDWWEEMAKKTVLRRLCKRLPASTDREGTEAFMRAVGRDEEDDAPEMREITPPSSLDDFAGEGEAPQDEPDAGDGGQGDGDLGPQDDGGAGDEPGLPLGDPAGAKPYSFRFQWPDGDWSAYRATAAEAAEEMLKAAEKWTFQELQDVQAENEPLLNAAGGDAAARYVAIMKRKAPAARGGKG